MKLLVLLPASLIWFSSIGAALIGLWALFSAPWGKLFAVSARQHLWYGSIAVLGLGWSVLGVDVAETFRVHPLLMTATTLVFGARLALVLSALSLAMAMWMGHYSWLTYPYLWLLTAVLPVGVTHTVLCAVAKTRIQNLFLYTLGVGFVAGLLTPLVIGFGFAASQWLFRTAYMDIVWSNLYVFLLFVFPEGFINGMVVSALAIWAPQLVKTYDEDFYLKR